MSTSPTLRSSATGRAVCSSAPRGSGPGSRSGKRTGPAGGWTSLFRRPTPAPTSSRTPTGGSAANWTWRRNGSSPTRWPARTSDSLLLGWAGWDHREQAHALITLIEERSTADGWDASRLKPLLAGLAEVMPWVRQWHAEVDGRFGISPAEAYDAYLAAQREKYRLTEEDLSNWTAPPVRRGRPPKTHAASNRKARGDSRSRTRHGKVGAETPETSPEERERRRNGLVIRVILPAGAPVWVVGISLAGVLLIGLIFGLARLTRAALPARLPNALTGGSATGSIAAIYGAIAGGDMNDAMPGVTKHDPAS